MQQTQENQAVQTSLLQDEITQLWNMQDSTLILPMIKPRSSSNIRGKANHLIGITRISNNYQDFNCHHHSHAQGIS